MAKPPHVVDTTPGEMPQVTPRDLHATSDIRFVMLEVQKLTTQVERLISDVKDQRADIKDLDRKVVAQPFDRLTDDVKDVKGKVSEIEKKVSFVKGAMWVLGGLFALSVAIGGLYLNYKRAAQTPTPAPLATPQAQAPVPPPPNGATGP